MQTIEFHTPFQSISQRVACSYLRSLSELTFVMPEGFDPGLRAGMEVSQRDLHAFFQTLYQNLYENPALFGLPVSEDMYVNREGPGGSKDQQEVNQKLKSVRKPIIEWLDFLMSAAKTGHIEGTNLVIDPAVSAAYLKKARSAKKFLPGLAALGLSVSESQEESVLTCSQFPAMMPALQAFAAACTLIPDERVGRFYFARCDFEALMKSYSVDPLDLYRIYNPQDFQRAAQLHVFFTGMGYKAEVTIVGVEYWNVKYQGNRKIKASPLFQMDFDERKVVQRQVYVKCASSGRIVELIPRHSQALQDDFFSRKNICNGDKCNWCDGKKGLGPSVLEYNGEQTIICWYTNPDMREFNDDTVELVKEYAYLHEELLPTA
jgi:hypothetical protein